MEYQRIIKGNFTMIPTGADLISVYRTYAVTEREESGEGNVPLSSYDSVLEAREFMAENKK